VSSDAPPGPKSNALSPAPRPDKPAPADPPAPPPKEDVLFVHSPSEAGEGYRVIRKRENTIEVGEIRAVQEGRPVHGDVVRLKPRDDHQRLFDVEVLMSRDELRPKAALGHAGPAQVATDAYRDNWDAIFGAHSERDLPN
jgi:hypothetical protein